MVVLFGAATIRFLYITKWEFIMNEHVGFTGGSILMDVGTEYYFLNALTLLWLKNIQIKIGVLLLTDYIVNI